jgi:hypothetical protein
MAMIAGSGRTGAGEPAAARPARRARRIPWLLVPLSAALPTLLGVGDGLSGFGGTVARWLGRPSRLPSCRRQAWSRDSTKNRDDLAESFEASDVAFPVNRGV